ncbi:VCBS repeat-containing protein [Myxococcus sp. K15C18031901]|uniref:FG-GAP repeat domain-containing protein n=1 Tax=Myxococcus dinghuensis TaxID=2906761 RepID=UPI0020A81181|nr:VCBS repeat-containing protein [Myxococcus dinghuensis]MCP3101183.1 VCBS repeat-containing protein [Myxococcus dinghuensis]
MKRSALSIFRLPSLLLALALALPGVSLAAAVTFCAGTLVGSGQSFVNYSGTYSGALASGNYLMTLSQSGPFTIQNLQASWNGIAIGTYQAITGSSQVTLSGILPGGLSSGQTVTVTFRIYNILGQLVDVSTTTVSVGGTSPGWTKVWTATSQSGVAGYAKHYIGDFDGDGAEDILAVDTGGWMTMFHYRNNDWEWGWSNYGSTSAGGGIYDYRNNLVIGDFDGDGKDEALGLASSWVTLFHFDNGTWNWGWSNYGSTSDQLYAHSTAGGYLISGNFDLSGNSGSSPFNKDEIVGVSNSGWITLFRLNAAGSGWDWLASTNGSTAHGMYPYRSNLRNGGDTNGDGQDELLGLGGWATTFYYQGGNFNWGWSNYGSGNIAGVGYPQAAGDVMLVGNIDSVDAKDEWFFIQNGPSAGWATTSDWNGSQFTWNWSNQNYSPAALAIGDWPLANNGGSNASYQLVRAVAGQPKHLLARRTFCAKDMRMYRISNTGSNY